MPAQHVRFILTPSVIENEQWLVSLGQLLPQNVHASLLRRRPVFELQADEDRTLASDLHRCSTVRSVRGRGRETTCKNIRSLVRSARKDAALAPEKRSGRAYRELFQFIKGASGHE